MSSPSQIEAAKSLMGESEKLMYDSMSEAEKMEFLLKKKEENMRIVSSLFIRKLMFVDS